MRKFEDISYGRLPIQKLDVYAPDKDGYTTLVWFHGGGITDGTRKDGTNLAESAVKHGYGFISAEYRMYPEARFPQYLLDAADAVAFTAKNIAQYGGNGKIVITGQSAGAYITMMLYMDKAYLQNAACPMEQVLCFISDSAQMTTHFNVLKDRGIDSRAERIDTAAPLYYTDVATYDKPLQMIWYSNDMPNRPEQNRLMLGSIRRFAPDAPVEGVELPGTHCEGSSKKDITGEYPYITHALRFIEKL